ncbi:transglutaminase-like domain-containing protein [Oscillospiraceae bacterium OttesenSCG-928-F05]|nr:transglutaminase-like domain-containing protein [Oscillospiraceae bacterium OttesenSCG-928-F05]
MKKATPRIAATVIALALVFAVTAPALAADVRTNPTTSGVILNGSNILCAGYNISGNNYFKLRDLMNALNKAVTYDAAADTISIDTSKPYTPDGSESKALPTGAATARPTKSNVTLNGAPVSFTAYNINGNNYFKLRDVLKALDIFVYWSGEFNAIYIDTTKGYEDEPVDDPTVCPPGIDVIGNGSGDISPTPITTKTVDGKDLSREDFSQAANPAVFTSTLTRGAYNAIRQTIVDREKIISGNDENGFNPYYHYANSLALDQVSGTSSAIHTVVTYIGEYYRYEMSAEPYLKEYYNYPQYFIVKVQNPAIADGAVAATRDIIARADALTSDAEKVRLLNDYLCDKLEYDENNGSGSNIIFTSNTPVKGKCTTYANAFQFLCDLAGIPSMVLTGENHAWNLVYADGKWGHVDVSYNDRVPSRAGFLLSESLNKTDENPQLTAFAQELLVPGSTK